MSEWEDFAGSLADEIFEHSKDCMMAHSIRAVQEYLRCKEYHPKYVIRYEIVDFDNGRYGEEIRGKRAYVLVSQTFSLILVNKNHEKEQQRRAIAHELGHVILAFEKKRKNKYLFRRSVDNEAERACNIFEEDLCAQHHKFNKNPENREAQLFPSLANHPKAN